jgi:hypothetical protein
MLITVIAIRKISEVSVFVIVGGLLTFPPVPSIGTTISLAGGQRPRQRPRGAMIALEEHSETPI